MALKASLRGWRYTNWVKTNFFKWTTDDDILVVILEPAAGSKLGDDAGTSVLGLMCVNVIGPSETYWHSLRVHPALRNKGCGRALFGAVQDLFFRLNAASSVARWSIVSENEFMVKWSTKLGLGQPRHFQRFQAEPTTDVADADGWEWRVIDSEDRVAELWKAAAGFHLIKQSGGTVCRVMNGGKVLWQNVNQKWLAPSKEQTVHALVVNKEIVAVTAFDRVELQDIGVSIVFSWIDGIDEHHIAAALNHLRVHGSEISAELVSGCLPVIDWLQSVTEASDFAAATDVEQWLYEWQNKASPGFEHLGIAGSTQPNGVAPTPAKAAATVAAAAHTPAKALLSPAKAAPSPAPAASTPEKTAIPRATKAPESPAASTPAKTAIPRATQPSDSSAKKSSSMDPHARKGSVPAEETLLALCRNVSPKALSQMIDSLDRNHDGMITYMELHSGLVKLGIDVEPGHLRQIVCGADENGDGRVSRAELEKMLTKMGSTLHEPVEPPSPAKRPTLVAASELEREIDRRISALEGTLTEKDVTIEMLKDTVEYLSRRVQWLLDPSTKANKRSQPTNPDKSPAASPVELGKKGKRTPVVSPQQDPQHVKGLLKKEAGVVLISEKKPNSRSSLSLGGQDDERGSTAFEKHVARSSSNRRASFIQGQLGHEAALKNPQAEEMLAVPGTEKTHFQTWEQRGSEGARVSFGKAQTIVYGPATYFPSADAAKAPIQGLALEYAYGYNGRAGRGSVFLSEQRVVYPLASIGVVRNRSNSTQWFFQRHSEEITCMAIHPQRALVASGQAAGRADGMASIRVWDSSVRDTTQLAQLSFHTSGVIAVAFSVDGTRLVSVGAEQGGSKVALWDWNARSSDDKPAVPLMTGLHGRDKPLGIAPLINGGFVSHGASSAKFWWVDNGTLQHERARFDDRQLPKAILGCLSVTEIVTVMAADNGNIYLFEGFDCKYVKKGHDGPINCVAPLHDANGLAGFATGGSDGQIHFWNPMYEVTHTYDLHELQDDLGLQRSFTIRSLDLIASDQQIIVGTKENEVYEIDVATKHSKLVTRGHNGNVRALAAHPSKPIVATGCDDAGVRFWDVRRHELLRACSFPRAVTAVALSSASEHAAVGLKESQLAVDAEQHKVHLDTHRESWGEGARQKLSARNHNLTIFVRIIDCETGREIVDITHPQPECVTALRYSPMANFLCVGTRNGQVYTYNVKEGYAHMHVVPMPKGTGSIMSISFTTDERYFACTSMDGVLHFVETHNGHRVMKAASMRDNVYADWSLTMGFQCQERYPQGPPSRAATHGSRTRNTFSL